MPVLYPGELATASKPFESIDEMWLAFGGLLTNKTPVINGDKHFTLPRLPGLSLHSHASRRKRGRPAAPQPYKGSSGSSRNPLVMHVAPSARSPDPFLSSEAEWSANSTDWDEVFQVSEYFNTPDIPLWTPLTNPSERRQVVRDNAGRCLNCHGIDHSFRNCAEPFINASGCINPQLGQLGDNGETCCRWQRRILSYRRPHRVGGENTRSSPSPHRRKNPSRRYDNSRRNNSRHSKSHQSHHGAPQLQHRRHPRRWPSGQFAYGLPVPAWRTPSTFLRYPHTRYALPAHSEHEPHRTRTGTFRTN